MSVSKLLQDQFSFTMAISYMIQFSASIGIRLTLGEGYIGDSIDKPHEDTPHLRHGFHFKRLAQDFNAFRVTMDEMGVPSEATLLKATEDYEALGEYWEQLGGTWGGRFSRPDGGHFSWGEGKRHGK